MEFEHPQATAVLSEMKKFSDVLEGALTQKSTGSFAAKDETETVEVVLDGDMVIKQLFIEDGLLRLGAETVQDRINEALMMAKVKATANLDSMREATSDAISEILNSMQKIVGE